MRVNLKAMPLLVKLVTTPILFALLANESREEVTVDINPLNIDEESPTTTLYDIAKMSEILNLHH